MNLDILKKAVVTVGMKCRKYSPEILVVAGTAAIIGSIVFACKGTLKVEDIIEEAEKKKNQIKTQPRSEEYTDQDAKRDMTLVYIKTGAKLAKVYLPAITLGAAGLGCFYGSVGILKRRNLALAAAYNAVDTAYKAYRGRVRDEVGEETEERLYKGIDKMKIDTVVKDENGKEKKAKKEAEVYKDYDDPNNYTPYAKYFDEFSKNYYRGDPERNMAFLKAQQNYANDLLHARGHLFLNEVYDMLDIPRTQAGQAVGWIMGMGDDFVDFGLYDGKNERVRAFVNGYEPSILLDFNVDGPIWDKI